MARDAVTAGALATAFSILPVEQSRELAGSMPGVQYLLVLAGGEEVLSAGWPRSAGLRAAAFERPKGGAAPAAGVWDPAYELSIDLTLPRMDYGRYRRPYVAVWIEDGEHFPVRTLALWAERPKYLPELREWYREDRNRSQAQGTDIRRTVSSATRPPGTYALTWDGKDNEGKPVKLGKYTICIEAAREHGGYDIERHELDFDARPKQLKPPAANELGAITIDYHKR